MEIEKIDKNFAVLKNKVDGKLIKIPSSSVQLFGLFYDEEKGFHRLPFDISDSINEGIKYLHFQTAGGRVGFSTNSQNITIHAEYDSLDKMFQMPLTGSASFSLCQYMNKKETHVNTFALDFKAEHHCDVSYSTKDNQNKDYILHFPLYNRVKHLYIEIDKDATIKPFNPYQNIKPILYYGSSITQGGCASRSDHSYQGFISKWLNIDFINLGFSGSCRGEDNMADYLSKQDCSVFVYDYDHNTPTVEYLKKTHEKLFLKFRETHPNTPVIFMSAPSYHYDPPILKKRMMVIKKTYQNALKRGDKNVYFINGATIYPPLLNHECSVDGCHPTDLGFYFMAKKVYSKLKRIFQ